MIKNLSSFFILYHEEKIISKTINMKLELVEHFIIIMQ